MHARRIVTPLAVAGILVALPVGAGNIQTDGQLVSTVAAGTPPLVVTSDTAVPGLNADLLDGLHSSDLVAQAQDETRTEIDSVPFTIDAPGSYYLSANQTMSVATQGISVNADHVTVDLGGFVLDGDGVGFNGIAMDGRTNVTIRNGTIRNFGAAGIQGFGSANFGVRVLDVRVEANGGSGISIGGIGNLIARCLVLDNGDNGSESGILIVGNGMVIDSVAKGNFADGIHAQHGSAVFRSFAIENGQDGIVVFEGTISESVARANVRSGIACVASRAVNNRVHGNNTGDTSGHGGLRATHNCYAADNLATENGIANIIGFSSDNVLVGNVALDGPADGIVFSSGGNFWADNRASGNVIDFVGTGSQTDGGGNTAF